MVRKHMIKFDSKQGVGYVLDGEGDFDESAHPRAENGEFSASGAGPQAAPKKGKMPTYVKAKEDILGHLSKSPGWEVHTKDRNFKTLKTPWAKNPGGARIEFHQQAVHYGHQEASRRGGSGGMLTLGVDIRSMSPHEFESKHRDLKPFRFEDE